MALRSADRRAVLACFRACFAGGFLAFASILLHYRLQPCLLGSPRHRCAAITCRQKSLCEHATMRPCVNGHCTMRACYYAPMRAYHYAAFGNETPVTRDPVAELLHELGRATTTTSTTTTTTCSRAVVRHQGSVLVVQIVRNGPRPSW